MRNKSGCKACPHGPRFARPASGDAASRPRRTTGGRCRRLTPGTGNPMWLSQRSLVLLPPRPASARRRSSPQSPRPLQIHRLAVMNRKQRVPRSDASVKLRHLSSVSHLVKTRTTPWQLVVSDDKVVSQASTTAPARSSASTVRRRRHCCSCAANSNAVTKSVTVRSTYPNACTREGEETSTPCGNKTECRLCQRESPPCAITQQTMWQKC